MTSWSGRSSASAERRPRACLLLCRRLPRRRNYSGSHEEIRRYALFGALASGQYDRWKQFAETCMAEDDLDGWTAKDLVNVTGDKP